MTHALKAWADWYVSCAGGNVPHEAQAAYDAIDEIKRLRSENEKMRSHLIEIRDGEIEETWQCAGIASAALS